MTQEDQIQSYLNDRLSESQKANFEKQLVSDVELKNALDNHIDMQAAFQFNEAEKLKKRFKDIESVKVNYFKKLVKSRFFYAGIAAILLLGVFIYQNTNSTSALYDNYIDIYPNVYQPITRASNTNDFSNAFVAYESQDFIRAKKEFENLLEHSENANLEFYYAMSLIQLKAYDAALHQLEHIDPVKTEFSNEITWYKALLYLQEDNIEKAVENLNTLEFSGSKYKASQRDSLLNSLQ